MAYALAPWAAGAIFSLETRSEDRTPYTVAAG